MSMSIVGSNTQAAATGSSTLTFTKPVGTTTGDLILVSLTANKNTWDIATPGFTQILMAEAGTNAFRSYLVYRIADGSEGSTIAFTKNTDTLSPLAGTMVVVRGCQPSSAAIQDSASAVQTTIGASTDPNPTISVTRSANPSRVLYWRTARNDASGNHDFSEGNDAGNGYDFITEVNAGTGTVRYGAAVVTTGDFTASTGSSVEPSGGILDTVSTTDNVHFLVALQGVNEADVSATLPAVTSQLAGEREIPAGSIGATLAPVTSSMAGTHYVPATGTLEATLPAVTASAEATVEPNGSMSASIAPVAAFGGETRQFGEHIIVVEQDHRAFLVVDDGTDVGLKPIKRSRVTDA